MLNIMITYNLKKMNSGSSLPTLSYYVILMLNTLKTSIMSVLVIYMPSIENVNLKPSPIFVKQI